MAVHSGQQRMFTRWSIALLNHFFGPQFEGSRVRLTVTREVLDTDFLELGGSASFLQVIDTSLEGLSTFENTVYARGLALHTLWKYTSPRPPSYPSELVELKDAPPYIPYLCLLCLAWTEGGEELNPNAFYDRLKLLCPNHGLSSLRLAEWDKLWIGLADWTERLNGMIGRFEVEILGGMTHVGIPKSQIIFTQSKIEKLPLLFAACSLQPGVPVTAEKLSKLIEICQGVARQILGVGLIDEIVKRSPVGTSALTMLLEFFDAWDGTIPHSLRGGNGVFLDISECLNIHLALSPIEDNTRWELVVALESDIVDGISIPSRGWRGLRIDPGFAIIVDSTNTPISGLDLINDEESTFQAKRPTDGEISTDIILGYYSKKLWIFENWRHNYLVEQETLPLTGGGYILVSSEGQDDWNNWIAQCGARVSVVDYTWQGLPADWALYFVAELQSLSAECRNAFPYNAAPQGAKKTRAICFMNGTKVRSTSARHIYAEYDPPLLKTYGPRSARLIVSGAVDDEILDADSTAARLPGSVVRYFALTVDTNASVVVAQLMCDGGQVGAARFGVWRESHITSECLDAMIDLDLAPFGGDGGEAEPWAFADEPDSIDDREQLISANEFCDNDALKLLESLHLNREPLPFQEFRRRAVRITGVESWSLYQEIRWLAQLGYIEIHTDSRGRWSHIRPLPLQIYLLPTKKAGAFQAVITGCASTQKWRKVLEVADHWYCEVFCSASNYRAIPPRLLLRQREAEAFELLSEQLGIQWRELPISFLLASNASGIRDWEDKIEWFNGGGPAGFVEYIHRRYSFVHGEIVRAPWHLRRIEDPFVRGMLGHILTKNAWDDDDGRYAFVRDYAWAAWKVQSLAYDSEGNGDPFMSRLPFDKARSSIAVPCNLPFPYFLGRALSMCSGLPPKRRSRHPAYLAHWMKILPSDSPAYEGDCWEYCLVPERIARQVAEKVSAKIIIVKS